MIFLILTGELICICTAVFVVFAYSEFWVLCFLPITLGCCLPMLVSTALKAKYSLFYVLFLGCTLLRYIVHPILIAFFREYDEIAMLVTIDLNTMNKAVGLMVYELLVCTVIIYYIGSRAKRREISQIEDIKEVDIDLPQNTGIYKIFICVVLLMLLPFHNALRFFSFGVVSFANISTSDMTVLEQITVIFVIAAKYFAYLLYLIWCKKKYDASNGRRIYAIFAIIGAFIFGCFYYGTNRMVFIFTFITAIYMYRLFFKYFWKSIIIVGAILGFFILSYLTSVRNYYNYLSGYSGIELTLRSYKSTINAYMGGVTNVAVAIKTKELYGEFATLGNFVLDLLRPIVGLNKLLPVRNQALSGSYYNYTFFNSTSVVSQIMPTIGHGYYYLGFMFAPLADVLILMVFDWLEKLRSKTMHVEIIYIFMVISMRIAMMYGINITILNNEISMQVLFPLFLYWINRKVKLVGRKKIR